MNQSSKIFPSLKLASFEPIKQVKLRQRCKKCGRKRMYFCYDCRLYVEGIETLVPKIELPLYLDIIKHERELNGKSTAIHAVLLAPNQTRIFDKFSEVPDYANSSNTVVLCPSKKSLSIEEFILSNGPINRLIVLDSTWNTVGSLKALPQLAKLPWVHLNNYQTEYWRPQVGLTTDHLATIEAIYFACCECLEAEYCWRENANKTCAKRSDNGHDLLDQLLFWFYFFREKIPAHKLFPYTME